MRAKLVWLLANIEELIAGSGLVFVVGLTMYNIGNRYLLQRSGVWAPELAEMVFAWVVFLGASAAWKRDMHISISVVTRSLSPRMRKAVKVLTDVILIAFLAFTTYLAAKITISSHTRVSPVLRVPFSYVYASVFFSFSLMLIRRVVSLVKSLRGASTAESR